MSSGVAATGTILDWDGAAVIELTSISGPTETMSPIDLTNHDSASAYREFVSGILDGGEISFEGNFIKSDATGQIAMHTDFQAGSTKAWIIKHPAWAGGVPQMSGNGMVTAFSLDYPYEDKISVSGTIKVTGKPTLAPA